jgi:hypothetical protein
VESKDDSTSRRENGSRTCGGGLSVWPVATVGEEEETRRAGDEGAGCDGRGAAPDAEAEGAPVLGRRQAEGAAGACAAAAEDGGDHEVVVVPVSPTAGDEAVPRSQRGEGAEAIPGGGADLQALARGRAVGLNAGSCWAAAARSPFREASRKEEAAQI